MDIVRFVGETGAPRIGVLDGEVVTAFPGDVMLSELLGLRLADLRSRCADVNGPARPISEVRLLPPVDGRTEIWAAGVTYENSRLARMEESEHDADIYARVYDAPRPELFFKATAWKARGNAEPIAVRGDSPINVPEPEAAVVVNAFGEIVGVTICNDLSSRSIEAENPLYIPQAKIYAGSCAVGPWIRPIWEVESLDDLAITLTITHGEATRWTGEASTGQLKRTPAELAACLFSSDDFPEGAIVSTGTCLVPELPFTLESGDVVSVSLGTVGVLSNTVAVGLEEYRQALAALPSEFHAAAS
ncbi:fumarylacetoacetate hydrolase family protein [Mycobacterium sp. NAZ190054]|uniref:fumarylacetoacetate hydrolase family protein n=1 Tax=Mycobacterium sp. NAZ190054 TaxID=1747766 RepID=UPI0007994C21|nr:fumarylacetoacetate hydrolase family protein [Mycobacterium sp. NAZ190054]KWX67927.1 hypothetical protein ASJ79_03970 [Mycobacterium sp. NAZ190054]